MVVQCRAVREQITGRTLGDFVVRDLLGEGGFGAVYRAEQPLLQREAVIKVVHHRLRASETIVQRFLREARLASHLDHPYAAHVYAFGAEPDGLLWIAMELVRGTPLDELLRTGGPLPLDRLVQLMTRICEVVHTAHEQGIVHRDIKPANVIVLSRAGRLLPKLLDFGIAKVASVDATRTSSPSLAAVTPNTHSTPDDVGFAATMSTPVADTANTPVDLSANGAELTHQGSVVGSPRYMAPEQWVDASTADARTDIYALAVLAYEALTGVTPFDGRTLHEIAVAHALGQIPSVAGRFPAALDAVFARALAKSAGDRYTSALEFAAAFREASGLGELVHEVVPQLDEPLRDALIADAPQPLAEAVAALAATTSIRQARDAIRVTVHVAVRLLGLIALACRTRLASRKAESDPVLGVLRDLRRRTLTDEEWLELAREVCRPFATKPDAFPIPELVTLFFDRDGTIPREPLAGSLAFAPQNERGGLSDDQVRELVQAMLPDLVRFLRSLAFLADYPLVIWRGDRAERWMGLRRPRRAALQVQGKVLEPEQPVLVDREGRPVLAMWPLLQIGSPSPGAPDELFLFDGKGRHGARLIAMPLDFERQDESLWSWFGDHLLDTLDGDLSGELPDAPYRGLAAFTPDDANLFFGREREVEGFVNRLRVQPLVAVVGPSGAGKSSFVQAGVAPALPEGWCVITVRPGPSPLAALEARLAQSGLKIKLTGDLTVNPATLGAALREMASAAGTTIVLVIDQLEELFTLCHDAEQRIAYAETLCQAARTAEDPIRVVLTLRDDFLVRAEQLAPLKTRLAQGLQLLATPAREDLLRIVLEPARRAGYDFEDRALPGQMVDAIADQPGALALLSFCAAKLWELRDRHFKQLGRRAYEAMGGVGGALAQHAEDMLTALPLDEQRLVREAFRHLVTAEGTRATLSRPELLQVIGGGTRAEVVVERLIQARLVVASESATGEERIEVIHEALLSAWPRLVEWRREDAEGARLRDQLRAAARQWQERGRPRGMLWRDETLAEYSIWRARHASALTEIEAAFASASLAQAARARRARGLLIAGTIVALAIGLGVLYRSNQATRRERAVAEAQSALASKRETEARENAALAQRRLVDQYMEQGRQATVGGDPRRALVFLEQATNEGATGRALELMIGFNAQRFAGLIAAYESGGLSGSEIDLSPDGRWVASAGTNEVVVWDAATGAPRHTLASHGDLIRAVRFDATAHRLATASRDGTVKIWDVSTGKLLHSLDQGGPVESIDLHGDDLIAVGLSAKLWNTRTGQLRASLVGHKGIVARGAFDPSGERLATGGFDGTVRLWRASDGRLEAVLEAHEGRVRQLRFSPDGRLLASAGFDDERVRLWDVATRRRLVEIKHRAAVRSIGFDRTGSRLVTGSMDRTAKVIAIDGTELFTIEAGSPVMFTAFSPDATQIVTACEDGSIRTWRADTAQPIWSFLGHDDAVWNGAFDAAGTRLAAASRDGIPRVWDVRYTGHVTLTGHRGNVWSSAFSSDGTRIATSAADGTVKVWDAGGNLKTTIAAGTTEFGMAAFSPSGAELAIASPSGASVYEISGATSRLRFALEGERRVTYLAYDPAGSHLATTTEQGSLRSWDAGTGKLLRQLDGHEDAIWYVTFSVDGKTIVTASQDSTARTWDAETGKQLRTFDHPLIVGAAELSADGTSLVSGGEDRLVRIWSVATGKVIATLEGHMAVVSTIDSSPNDRMIVTASHDGTVRLWDLETRSQLATIDSQASPFYSAHFSPDGRKVVATSGQGRVNVWPVPDRVPRETIEHLVRCRVPVRLRRSDTRPCGSRNAHVAQPGNR